MAQTAEVVPENELPPLRTDVVPAPIRLTTRDPAAYDVYSADGALLGRVKLPPHHRLSRAWGFRVGDLTQQV